MQNVSSHKIYFEDRADAARQLIEILPVTLLRENEAVVIGVSEEGVYLADQIAKAAEVRMDILLTEPIMAPNNTDVAIAMISETEEVVMHKALVDAFGINEEFVYSEARRKYEEEILGYVYRYRKGNDIASLKGKYVVLVDICVETGLTMMAALKSVIAREAKNIFIATPILDRAVYENLLSVCDGVFCPHRIRDYISVEYYYRNFKRTGFEEIVHMMSLYDKRQRYEGRSETIQGNSKDARKDH